jgi:hypothetical protein
MLLPAGILNVFITGALLLWGQPSLKRFMVFDENPGLRLLGIVGLIEIAIVLLLTAAAPQDAQQETSAAHGSAHPSPGHGHAHTASATSSH